MSNDSSTSPAPKRPLISLPFIVIVGVLAVAAYFAGPTVMTYVIYFQEKMSVTAPIDKVPGPSVDGMAGDENYAGGEYGGGQTGGGEGGGGNRGARRGGGFDPEAFFAERDVDGNGKLEGDEISERMQETLAETDTDKDGAVSKEEFLARAAQRGGRGEGGGGGGRQGARPAADSPEDSPADAAAESPPSESNESLEPQAAAAVPEN